MVMMESSGLSLVPSKLRREKNVIMGTGCGVVVKTYFLPESDSLHVQTLLVAVGCHHLPEECLPLYLEAKKRSY